MKLPEKIAVAKWRDSGYILNLYSDGTTEVIDKEGNLTCLYAWEDPSILNLPRFVQVDIVEQRKGY